MNASYKESILHRWVLTLSAVLLCFHLGVADGFEPGVELGWNDEDMILFFGAHKAQFRELMDKVAGQQQLIRVDRYMVVVALHSPVKIETKVLSDLRQRMLELQLDGAIKRDSKTGALFFGAKSFGFLAHGTEKGFCFLAEPPANVVPDMDLEKSPKRRAIYYRKIEDHWYLYMIEG